MNTKGKRKEDRKNLILRGETWYFNVMINGKLLRQSLHTSSIVEARKIRDRLLGEVQLGGGRIPVDEDPARSGILLADAWEKFVRCPTRGTCASQQMDNHKTNWRMFMEWLGKRHPDVQFARQVNRSIGTEWAADELERVVATNTFNKHLTSVKCIFRALGDYDEKIINPVAHIKKRKEEDAIGKEPFTPQELRAIFSCPDEEFVRLCAIGLYTSLRLGSARKLTWDMFTHDLSYLAAVHDKTGSDASQAVSGELREILQRVPPGDRIGYLCPKYASKLKANVCSVLQAMFQRCGITTQRYVNGRVACVKGFHSFRHTAITLALQNGATVAQVRRWAGHASDSMQMRYTHLGADDAGKASAAIGKVW